MWIPTAQKINRLAIASLVSSLVFPLWPLSSIAAVVMGIVSMRQLGQRPSERGVGFAVAGLVVGLIIVVVLALFLAFALYIGHECRNGC
jgi:uncharacterized protein YacL